MHQALPKLLITLNVKRYSKSSFSIVFLYSKIVLLRNLTTCKCCLTQKNLIFKVTRLTHYFKMWSEENTEALKNKIAELKNKSLKKQNMENSSETTNMEFTHAQRWDLSVMKILELESSLKEQGLEMAGLEKKISDLSDDCCNQKRKNEDDYLAYQQTLKVGKSKK